MRTLVIHPFDTSTNFLEDIYIFKKDWTIIDTNPSHSFLKTQIKGHDRIIMLGHGDEYGMFGFNRYVIDSSLVYLLRERHCVCIWCNADKFVEKYKLKGLYTGMIISEMVEAEMYNISCEIAHISSSNVLFAHAIQHAIDADDPIETAKELYTKQDNPIIDFNSKNIFHT